jgi:hypothetical protein
MFPFSLVQCDSLLVPLTGGGRTEIYLGRTKGQVLRLALKRPEDLEISKQGTWRVFIKACSSTHKGKKVKLSLCLTNQSLRHEDVWGSQCIGPRFLDLGTSWRWVVVSFTLRPLYSRRKSPRYPLDRWLGGPQSRSGQYGEVKILAPNETQTPPLGRPAPSQSLYWLRYPGSPAVVL